MITNLNYLDPVIAILVAVFILKKAFELLKSAFNPLLDIKLSDEEIEIIKNNINKYSSVFCNYHELKTRKSGRIRYAELHLESCDKTCNCIECKKSL